MRKALVALSLSTIAFATSTVYLARELWLVRTSGASVARRAEQPAPLPAPVSQLPTPGVHESPKPGPESASAPGPSTSIIQHANGDSATQAREFLATRADPARWRQLIEKEKNLRRYSDPTLARHLRLDAAAYEHFLEALVMQDLALREKVSRCSLDPQCRLPSFDQGFVESLAAEASATVGADVYSRYTAFQETRSERETVASMRGRLTDRDYLADAQAEKFALAMADERRRIDAEAAGSQLNFGSFGNGNIMIYTGDDATAASAADDLNRRMRDRAAQLLTPAQALVYQQMQEEAMDGYRNMARMQETAAEASP